MGGFIVALINCPGCAKEISDKAVSCPGCGCLLIPSASHANETDRKAISPPYSGGVFDFGIWNLIKLEMMTSGWRWLSGGRRRRRKSSVLRSTTFVKSVYESKKHSVNADNRRIDISKGKVTKIWVLGLLGTLGLYHFVVGRIATGVINFLWGLLWWIVFIACLFDSQMQEYPLLIMMFFILLFIPSTIGIVKIRAGKFRDVFRNFVT